MQDLVRKQSEALSNAKSQINVHQEQKGIDAYKAVTERMRVLLPLDVSPKDKADMLHEMMMAEHQTNLGLLGDAHKSMLSLIEAHNQPEPDPSQDNAPAPSQPTPQAAE